MHGVEKFPLWKRGMNTPSFGHPSERGELTEHRKRKTAPSHRDSRMEERGVKQPSHIERDTPLTIPSPLGGEDEGEGEKKSNPRT